MNETTTYDIFRASLIEQLRAIDQWGSWSKYTDDDILKLKYIKSREEMQDVPLTADIDERTLMNIRMFLQAIARGLEQQTGAFTSVVVDINHEGFGRGLILTKNTILLEKVYREAHRFHFTEIDKLITAGQKMLDTAMENYEKLKDCIER